MFDFLFKAKKPDIFFSRQLDVQAFRQAIYPPYESANNANRYCTQEDIYSVIRFLATTSALIPIYAYTDDEPEDTITALLQRPNNIQAAFEFYESLHSYLLLEGECFIYKETLELGANRGKIILHSIPPQEIVLMVNEYGVVGFQRIRNGIVVKNYLKEDIIHVKYFNPSGSDRGLSPLKVLLKTFALSEAQQNAMIAQMQNGGVSDIVFDKVAYNDGPEITNSRKDSFMRFIKDSANKGAPYFAAGEMQSIKLGSTLADMQVLESLKIPFKKICNVYGTSDIIFNSDSSSTESNVKEKKASTYTNTILPNIRRINSGLEMGLDLYSKGITIREDISEVTELQEDMAALINSLNVAWWLTPNQKLEAMKYDKRDESTFDQPFIPSGLTPLEDYLVPELNLPSE